jgi:acetyl esterase/lipase
LPNYRLIPESTGADILEDLNDFWTWFNKRSVDDFLTSKGHALDLDYRHILATGESAGGYMALMSALTQPQAKGSGGIKAVLAQYPMTNYLRCSPSETFMGRPSPKEPELDAHLSSIEPGTIISSAFPPARTDISDPLAAYNRYLDYFGHDKNLWPIGLVGETGKDGEGRQLPPTWIIHGDADTAVDVEDSKKFLEKCKSVIGKGVEVRLELREGMEHRFDIEMKEDEEKWLREGLKWVEGEWLS